ncbi:hypothetical protein [Coprococcus sp. RTP21281st1_F1_RTP21281_210402]|uniref:hypothetical protein n=1 Tax=Coprococcus sp. RTP21281st1_F1_RTP21281_210402 TaxID=3143208 RepID=UPI0034A3E461
MRNNKLYTYNEVCQMYRRHTKKLIGQKISGVILIVSYILMNTSMEKTIPIYILTGIALICGLWMICTPKKII